MSAAVETIAGGRPLTLQLIDLQNVVDETFYYNEAIMMAAAALPDRGQMSALQVIVAEVARRLERISDGIEQARATVSSEDVQ